MPLKTRPRLFTSLQHCTRCAKPAWISAWSVIHVSPCEPLARFMHSLNFTELDFRRSSYTHPFHSRRAKWNYNCSSLRTHQFFNAGRRRVVCVCARHLSQRVPFNRLLGTHAGVSDLAGWRTFGKLCSNPPINHGLFEARRGPKW